jgi:hypothetical protein
MPHCTHCFPSGICGDEISVLSPAEAGPGKRCVFPPPVTSVFAEVQTGCRGAMNTGSRTLHQPLPVRRWPALHDISAQIPCYPAILIGGMIQGPLSGHHHETVDHHDPAQASGIFSWCRVLRMAVLPAIVRMIPALFFCRWIRITLEDNRNRV